MKIVSLSHVHAGESTDSYVLVVNRDDRPVDVILNLINSLLWSEPPDFLADVREFHKKFNQSYDGPPRAMPLDEAQFRGKFQIEEATELADAIEANNQEQILDAEVDSIYVAVGTADKHGHDLYEAWRRVHAHNMMKEPAPDGTFKITKPPGWVPADLSDLVGPPRVEEPPTEKEKEPKKK